MGLQTMTTVQILDRSTKYITIKIKLHLNMLNLEITKDTSIPIQLAEFKHSQHR
jgi:hypothetical protein